MRLIFPIAGIILLSLSACFDNSDCGSVNTSTVNIGFYNLQTGNTLAVFFDSIYTTELVTLADPTNFVQRFELPLNPESNSVTMIFRRDLVTDTIAINYSRVLGLIHPDCEGEVIYNNLEIVNSTFESFVITARNIRRTNDINLEIYL